MSCACECSSKPQTVTVSVPIGPGGATVRLRRRTDYDVEGDWTEIFTRFVRIELPLPEFDRIIIARFPPNRQTYRVRREFLS